MAYTLAVFQLAVLSEFQLSALSEFQEKEGVGVGVAEESKTTHLPGPLAENIVTLSMAASDPFLQVASFQLVLSIPTANSNPSSSVESNKKEDIAAILGNQIKLDL